MTNILESPAGFLAFWIGILILSEVVKAYLRNGAERVGERARSKEGVIFLLLLVGVIWVIFAREISMLFAFINENGFVVMGIALFVIAFLIWKFRGSKEV